MAVKVDLPVEDGGLPGRRLSGGADRGRALSVGGQSGGSEASSGSEGRGVKTPSIGSFNTNGTKVEREQMSEYCDKLRQENVTTFHQECCLNNLMSDPRCALKTLLTAYEEQQEVCKAHKTRRHLLS